MQTSQNLATCEASRGLRLMSHAVIGAIDQWSLRLNALIVG